MNTSVALIILDGWGIGIEDPGINAVEAAKVPFIQSLAEKYPHSTLLTSGEDVGLPAGQMGNSEVGHLNIGAGRVVYQQLALINKAIEEKVMEHHPVLMDIFKYVKENGKKLHLMGLVSNGGVHSSMDHIKALLNSCVHHEVQSVFLHAFTDGRDTDPKSGLGFIQDLEEHMNQTTGKIATIIGRYYAMDRDKRWERIKLAYDLIVNSQGTHFMSATEAIEASYHNSVTDEFIKPVLITDAENQPLTHIEDGDAVIFFNFRTDRGRELTQVLTQEEKPEFDMHPLNLEYITMTEYDATYRNVKILFPEQDLDLTLGEVLEKNRKKQLRIAETEKYPHVTFFFSGGREAPFEGEERLLVPSPKVTTYDLEPQMSAEKITDALIPEIESRRYDFFVLNFANPDMVGHTGVFPAVVKALETVDRCTKKIVEACQSSGYDVLILADHGNAEFMVNPDGSPNTAHTTNPVPLYLISDNPLLKLKSGRLADIAPTVLSLMGIDAPPQMTGEVLIEQADA
jgi:2,3-bisphosphoglycerate-independent phosphoglycerate mutase